MLARRSTLPKLPSRILRPNHKHLQLRSFHPSRPKQGVLIDLSHSIFQNVHSFTGLPWAFSIPFTAAVFRLSFLPIQYWSSLNANKRLLVAPPVTAATKIAELQTRALAQQGHFKTREEEGGWFLEQSQRRTRELLEKHGASTSYVRWLAPLSFLPVWVINAGVIQSMSGIENNIFSFFRVDPAAMPPPEPSFETEGFLHIPILTDADPFWLLPAAFAVLQWLNANRMMTLKERHRQSQLRRRLPRSRANVSSLLLLDLVLLLHVSPFAFAAILVYNQSPTSLVLYLCGSAATQLLLGSWVSKLVGRRQPPSIPEPQVPQLKRRHRKSLQQMDQFRPDS